LSQRIHKSSALNPSRQAQSTQAQNTQAHSQEPLTQAQIENETFTQSKFEALGLQMKQARGSISPIEQERLGVLQAKMDDFWVQRLEHSSRFGHNLTQIPAHAPGARNKTGLPDPLKANMEHLSGLSLNDVKVHYNSPKPAQLQALAYTQGSEIHIGQGQERHLAHEAWHVVQQKQGRVKPTFQMKGVGINDDHGLEREADTIGAKALHMGNSVGTSGPESGLVHPNSTQTNLGHVSDIVQRSIDHDAPAYTANSGRAGSVEVTNIRGKPLGPSANAPPQNQYVFGWQQLHAAEHTLAHPSTTRSHYNAVRMHLWNGRLGGPGNDDRNLAPGPALVNSSMSAGPETASKDAVSAGYRIWLKTTVTYQNNPGVATDFTCVVPNNMTMSWGYMEDSLGNKAPMYSLGGPTVYTQGAAEPPGWSMAIDQPPGALSSSVKAAYQGYTATDTAALDLRLGTASRQELGQAFGLVIPDLKKYMVLKYRDLYLNMQDTDREEVLTALTVDQIKDLINTTLGLQATDYRIIYDLVLETLSTFTDLTKLQTLFDSFSTILKGSLLTYYQWDLLQHLGDVGRALRKTNRTTFNYAPKGAQYGLLDKMSKSEISTLLNNRSDKKLFDDWAKFNNNKNTDERFRFIQSKVPQALADKYKDSQKIERREEGRQEGISKGTVRTSARFKNKFNS
jgi:Domain of unknown function (DUF4157)